MDRLTDITYIKQNVTKQWLLSNNFYYNSRLSDEESEVYSYRFPVYKYDKFTTLECEFSIVLGKETVTINVYNYRTYDKYAPFYYYEYGNYGKLLDVIWRNINKQLKLLGITKEKTDKERNDGGKCKKLRKNAMIPTKINEGCESL